MQDCDGEFADGGVVQKDFQALMESHIAAWSANTDQTACAEHWIAKTHLAS